MQKSTRTRSRSHTHSLSYSYCWTNVCVNRHGVRQLRSAWADGPEFVTQCPIRPGGSFTYRFTIQGQEGTLWWHAHSSWLRATVYGALIIRPKLGDSYPFPKPNREAPLLLGNIYIIYPPTFTSLSLSLFLSHQLLDCKS